MRDNRQTTTWLVSSLASLALAAPSVLGFSGGKSIGVNFGGDEPSGANTAVVAADEIAGITEAAQKNWNNTAGNTGTMADLVMDDQGAAVATTASVEWADSPNTWSSTGRGEENNAFPDGPDFRLMTGYLDTNADSTTTVTITGIPASLAESGYNVVLYSLGGVAARGGGFWVEDGSGNPLTEVKLGTTPANPAEYIEDLGVDHVDEGNYMVFLGLSASTIAIKASTESTYGFGGTERAGLNAVQLVEISAESAPVFRNPTGDAFSFSVTVDDLGSAIVDEGTVSVKLDGADVAATVTKSGSRTTATYNVFQAEGRRFASGSTHSVEVSLKTTDATDYANTASFTVGYYATLTSDLKVTPDTSMDGFVFAIHQTEAGRNNNIAEREQQIAGLLGINVADSWASYDAVSFGTPDTSTLSISNVTVFEYEGVINFGQDPVTDGDQGNAGGDRNLPGIPGQTSSTDNIAGEIVTYIELPAGMVTLIVNSDDGFEASGGVPDDVFKKVWMGEFNGGRGAADTPFNVYVEEAGVYAFRNLWFEGGGGANIEILCVIDGNKVLLNDTANGGYKLYRALQTPSTEPAINSVSPAIGATGILPGVGITAILEEKGDAIQQASIQLTVNGADVDTAVSKAGDVWTASYDLPAGQLWPSGRVVEAGISFTTAGGATRSETWTFDVAAYRGPILDNVRDLPVLVIGNASQTGDAGGRSGAPGDLAFDVGVGDGSGLVPDISFLNANTADDTLTVAFWQKLREVRNSSAFWMGSASSGGNNRGFQAHVPWSDNAVVFDTSGCCAADTQRINALITDYWLYSGDASWWEEWHHFAFVKNGTSKEIYIDGNLFHAGLGDPLMTDFTDMVIGAEEITVNRMNGMLDDFAIYDGGLTADQAMQLAGGAAPDSVAGGPLVWWDFDTALPPDEEPEITSIVLNSDGSITIEWVGDGLESATDVNGPWTGLAGAANPYTFTPEPGTPVLFIRASNP